MIEQQVNQQATPVQSKERIEFVDILRGFAVLGILVVNYYGFAGMRNGASNLGWPSDLDRLIIILTEFLIRAKFYTLFSFMFGWGMGLQMLRAQSKGRKFCSTLSPPDAHSIGNRSNPCHLNLVWRYFDQLCPPRICAAFVPKPAPKTIDICRRLILYHTFPYQYALGFCGEFPGEL